MIWALTTYANVLSALEQSATKPLVRIIKLAASKLWISRNLPKELENCTAPQVSNREDMSELRKEILNKHSDAFASVPGDFWMPCLWPICCLY